MALSQKQHDTLIEIFVERVVDNMNTVQLAEYVSADMVETFLVQTKEIAIKDLQR